MDPVKLALYAASISKGQPWVDGARLLHTNVAAPVDALERPFLRVLQRLVDFYRTLGFGLTPRSRATRLGAFADVTLARTTRTLALSPANPSGIPETVTFIGSADDLSLVNAYDLAANPNYDVTRTALPGMAVAVVIRIAFPSSVTAGPFLTQSQQSLGPTQLNPMSTGLFELNVAGVSAWSNAAISMNAALSIHRSDATLVLFPAASSVFEPLAMRLELLANPDLESSPITFAASYAADPSDPTPAVPVVTITLISVEDIANAVADTTTGAWDSPCGRVCQNQSGTERHFQLLSGGRGPNVLAPPPQPGSSGSNPGGGQNVGPPPTNSDIVAEIVSPDLPNPPGASWVVPIG